MIPSQKTQSPSNDLHRPPQACSCTSNVLAPFLFHSLCFRAVAFAGKINTPILSSPHLLPVSASQWGSEQPLPPGTQTCTRLLAVIECTICSAFLIMFLLVSLSDATVFFFPFFPSHMYTHMCACACRLKVDARNDPHSLPSYSLSRVSQSNSELTDMASFISQIVLGILFLPSETGMTGGPPNWLAFR